MSFPPFQSGDRFGAVESAYHELRAWLTTKISWFEQVQLLQSKSDSAASMDYEEYLRFRSVRQVAIDRRCVVRRKGVASANNVLNSGSRSDYALRREAYERLKHLQEANRDENQIR